MANKTVATAVDPDAFLAAVEPAERRADGMVLAQMMARLSGEPARMWGPTIVGFGEYHYRTDSGRAGDMCRIGFSPRKAELVLYLSGLDDADFASLGKYRRGAGCLYVKRLAQIDLHVLEGLIAKSLAHMDTRYLR